jgi:O-antigen ligase
MALAAALVYFVLAGGTNLGTYLAPFAAVNAAVASVLIALWLVELPRRNDLTDRLLLVALLAYLLTCVASAHPRMSFDAATSVTASVAAFGIARGELLLMRAERAMITVLALCGLVLAAGLLATWIPYWMEWWRGTGTIPPLDLPLQPGPYRHYHIAAMLLALLLPAELQLRRRRRVWPVAIVAAIAALAVVLMSGSRTAWLALLVVGVAAALLKLRPRPAVVVGTGALAIGLLAALAFTGALASISSRLLNTYTLAIRAETWSSGLATWLDRPLLGWGPGSFAAVFRFQEDVPFFPDPGGHAHNLVVQVLLEAGLIGLAALAVGVAGLAIGIWHNQRRSAYAIAGLALFGLMSLVDLPSNFVMVLAIGISWAALAAPRSEAARSEAAPRRRAWPVAVSGAIGAAIVVAVASTLLAMAAFDEARRSVDKGDLPAAREALDRSVAFDPSMALYWREKGARALEAGERSEGRTDLERARHLNPGDATTLRLLAVLAADDGRQEDAIHLARRAVDVRRTQFESHVLLAWIAGQAGDDELVIQALTDALTWHPWAAAAPTWADTFGFVAEIPVRHAAGARGPESDGRQRTWEATWLRAMTGVERIPDLAATLAVLDATIRCDLSRASGLLEDAGRSAHDRAALTARLMLASLTGDEEAYRAAVRVAILRRSELATLATTEPGPAAPFSDYEGDIGLYRRIPLAPMEWGPMLPTYAEGLAAWLQDPSDAARRGAPESGLATCTE